MHEAPRLYLDPVAKPPLEAKVKAMTLVQYLVWVAVLAVLQVVYGDLTMIAFLPDWLETILIPLFPTAITAAAGYRAKHQPRPDLPASKR